MLVNRGLIFGEIIFGGLILGILRYHPIQSVFVRICLSVCLSAISSQTMHTTAMKLLKVT